MSSWLVSGLSWAFLVGGVVFAAIGAVGLIRLPDVYARMHASGIIDTLAAGLILLGLVLQGGWSLVSAKLLLILAFIFFTSPTSTHALARAVINAGLRPVTSKIPGKDAGKEGEPSGT